MTIAFGCFVAFFTLLTLFTFHKTMAIGAKKTRGIPLDPSELVPYFSVVMVTFVWCALTATMLILRYVKGEPLMFIVLWEGLGVASYLLMVGVKTFFTDLIGAYAPARPGRPLSSPAR